MKILLLITLLLSFGVHAKRDGERKAEKALEHLMTKTDDHCGSNKKCKRSFERHHDATYEKLHKLLFAESAQDSMDNEGLVIAEERCVVSYSEKLLAVSLPVDGADDCTALKAQYRAYQLALAEQNCIDRYQETFDLKGWSYSGNESCDEMRFAYNENVALEEAAGSGSGSGGQ